MRYVNVLFLLLVNGHGTYTYRTDYSSRVTKVVDKNSSVLIIQPNAGNICLATLSAEVRRHANRCI